MIVTFSNPSLLVANLKAALLAVSDDPSRSESVRVLRIELRNQRARFVATNGHWLWVNEISAEEIVGVDAKGRECLGATEDELLLTRVDVKRVIKSISVTRHAGPVELDTKANHFQQAGNVLRAAFTPRTDVTFPAYATIMPREAPKKTLDVALAIDAHLLRDLAEAFTLVGSRKRDDASKDKSITAPFAVYPVEKLGPFVCTCVNAPSALALLMPVLVDGDARGANDLLEKYRAA